MEMPLPEERTHDSGYNDPNKYNLLVVAAGVYVLCLRPTNE
jgi:hypothetical protein